MTTTASIAPRLTQVGPAAAPPVAARPRSETRAGGRRSRPLTAYQFLAPYLVLFGAFIIAPRELSEAAEMDGASRSQQFWNVTLVSLRLFRDRQDES